MTVRMVIALLKIPYIRMYVWFWPTLCMCVFVPGSTMSSTRPGNPFTIS